MSDNAQEVPIYYLTECLRMVVQAETITQWTDVQDFARTLLERAPAQHVLSVIRQRDAARAGLTSAFRALSDLDIDTLLEPGTDRQALRAALARVGQVTGDLQAARLMAGDIANEI